MEHLVELLDLAIRICAPVFSIFIVFKCFFSLRDSRREKVPLVSLRNKDKAIPVMFWENSIGRSKSSDIVLKNPTVSRDHAVLYRRQKSWMISDTSSRSGVEVNGKKITQNSPVYIDDKIKIGSESFVFKKRISSNDNYDLSSKTSREKIRKPANQYFLILAMNFFHFLLSLESYFCFLKSLRKQNINIGAKEILNTEKLVLCFLPCAAMTALSWIFFIITRILGRKNFELEIAGLFLSGIGLIIIGSEKTISNTLFETFDLILMQFISLVLGFLVFCVTIFVIENLDAIPKLRMIVTILAVVFFLINIAIAKEYNGSNNWIIIGPVSIQPSEFIKIAFVFCGASSLDKLQTKENLGGFIGFSAFCIACLFLMKDFGTACVFFVAFLICSFMRSGSIRTFILSCSAAIIGGFMVLKFKPYVAQRFSVWRHVFENANDAGYQQSRALTYSASGGFFGVGTGNGCLKYIFAGKSDLMFPVILEELGLLVGISVIFCFALWALFSRSSSERCRSTFYSISSCTAAGILVFQSCLHIFGSTDVLPMTGVTLPFVSLGGSSLISSWGLLAFIKACDDRTYALKGASK